MAWLVDIIPALQYLPESFPGATFQKTARNWRRSVQATAYLPYEFVQRQMQAGTNRPSYVSRVLENFGAIDGKGLDDEDEAAIIWSAASLYGAVADTAVITLSTFTLAMTKFPYVQRRAQEEIDRVVGTGRLPTVDDRHNLPYVDAVVKEAMRWWPIASMGFPHTVTEDLAYDGYHIPEGSMILPNVWWFLHDPEVYAEPEKFDPSRYLAPRHEPDPDSEAFGYGRRKCPGRFFADDGIYLNLAMTLATMNIRKAIGADGREIDLEVRPKPGVLTHPTDFGFSIKPRSDKHRELIQNLEKECPFEPSDSELIGRVEDFQLRT